MNTPNHQTVRQQLWCNTVIAVAASSNSRNKETMTLWADFALAAFDERFPETPAVAEPPTTKTIRIGNYDVPEPYRSTMEAGQTFYLPEPLRTQFYGEYTWDANEYDARYMQRGLVHLTPEAAALHGKAIVSLTAGEGVDL